jgi:hypothetical protein
MMKKFSAFLVFAFTMVVLTGSAFAWPGYLEGKPDTIYRENGYFIWHDNSGLHLRTADKGRYDGRHVFTGVIRTDGKFINIDDRQTERGDHIWVSRDRDTINFRLSSDRGLEGLDFRIRGGEHVSFELYMDGKRIDRKDIFLGNNGRHPKSSKFSLAR